MPISLQRKEVGPTVAYSKTIAQDEINKNWKYFLHQLYSSGRKRKINGKVKR